MGDSADGLLCKVLIHRHHGEVVAVHGGHLPLNLVGEGLVRHGEAEGRHHVEDEVGVGGAGDHAEVVEGEAGVDALHQRHHRLLRLGHQGVVRRHGVHVDDGVAVQLRLELALNVVDLVVDFQQVGLGGDLRVEGDHQPPGAVVVDQQVVDADDGGVGQHQRGDLVHELLGGRGAQQGIDGVLCGVEAGKEDEGGHGHAAPAVDLQPREAGDQGGDEHRGGGHGVAEGVGGGGLHGGGVDLLADGAVVEAHIQLHRDGHAQNGDDQGTGIHRLGVQDFFDGGLAQLEAHEEDEHGNRQAGEVLDAAVAEGVVGVRLLARQLEAQERDDGGAGVGEVVEGVGGDGDGAGEGAGEEFTGKEQDVQSNAHRAAEDAVGLAQLLRGLALGADEGAGQKRDHRISVPFTVETGSDRPRRSVL